MAFRTLLRTLLFVCALFLVDNDARAQTSEIPLSSSPFSLVGPFFQDMEVKAREGEALTGYTRRTDVVFNGPNGSGVIFMIVAGLDIHFISRGSLRSMVESLQKPSLERGDALDWGKKGRMRIGLGRYDFLHYVIGTRTCVAFSNYFNKSGSQGWLQYIAGTVCTPNAQDEEALRTMFAGIGIAGHYTPTLTNAAPEAAPKESPRASAPSGVVTRGQTDAEGSDGVYAVRLIYAGKEKPGCLGGELKAEFTVVQDSIRGYFNHPQVGFFLLKGRLDGNRRLVDAVAEGGEKVFFEGGFEDGAGTGSSRSDQSGCRGAWAATRN
jgi:hypothetical protein